MANEPQTTTVHFVWADVQNLIKLNPLAEAQLNNIRLQRERAEQNVEMESLKAELAQHSNGTDSEGQE
jgi:hypothetical protein